MVQVRGTQGDEKTIKYEEYRKLPATEQENYKVIPQMKYYNVFNIDQTDFAGKYPERYERMKRESSPKTIRTE